MDKSKTSMNSSEFSSKVFITSDTHFNHNNILKYEPGARPWADKHAMDEGLIERWNSVVGVDDIVFHLGDFAFAGTTYTKEIISRLNGRIILLLGNHDRPDYFAHKDKWNNEFGFFKIIEDPFILDGKYIFTHEPLESVPNGMVNVYGHIHTRPVFNTIEKDRFCVCVERHDCMPVEYDKIKNIFENPLASAE